MSQEDDQLLAREQDQQAEIRTAKSDVDICERELQKEEDRERQIKRIGMVISSKRSGAINASNKADATVLATQHKIDNAWVDIESWLKTHKLRRILGIFQKQRDNLVAQHQTLEQTLKEERIAAAAGIMRIGLWTKRQELARKKLKPLLDAVNVQEKKDRLKFAKERQQTILGRHLWENQSTDKQKQDMLGEEKKHQSSVKLPALDDKTLSKVAEQNQQRRLIERGLSHGIER